MHSFPVIGRETSDSHAVVRLWAKGEELTDEDRYEMQSLFEKLKYVEKRQTSLKEAVDADLKRVWNGPLTFILWDDSICAPKKYTDQAFLSCRKMISSISSMLRQRHVAWRP